MPAGSGEFISLLGRLNYGHVADELDEKVEQLEAAVRQHQKPGTILLSITMKPTGKTQVEVAEKITLKVPEAERQTTYMFFRSETDSRLTTRDPRQPGLPEGEDIASAVSDSLAQGVKHV